MGLIPDNIIARVLESADIVQLISAYVPLKKAGRNFRANCPFHHEKTPSFMVSPDKQIYHCFGCGEGGNVISFLMKQENIDFPEAVRRLAQRAGIAIPRDEADRKINDLRQSIIQVNGLAAQFFQEILKTSMDPAVKQGRDYLKKRGVGIEIVEKFKLGFAPDQWDALLNFLRKKDIEPGLIEKAGLIIAKDDQRYYDRFRNRVMFPIFDVKGQCVGFGARSLEDGVAKYINSPETPVYTKGQHLYGLHLSKDVIAQNDTVIVVEGYMDFIMPFQAGVANMVASCGTALTPEQIRLMRRYTRNVIMLFDTDAAGQSAMVRSLDALIEEGMNVRVATLAENEDPDSFVRKHGAEAFQERLKQAKTIFDYKLGTLTKKFNAKSLEGRVAISKDMLQTISKFDNAIIQSEYIKRLAQSLFVAEEALIAEIKKLATKPLEEVRPSMAVKEQPRMVERNILKLLLEDEAFVPKVKGEIAIDDFRDENIRSIIGEIFRMFEQGVAVTPVNLMNNFAERHVLEMISAITVDEHIIFSDKEKIYRDCIDRILQDRRKSQRQELLEQIRLAEMAGDETALHQLKEKFHHLVKR